jgi:hypothetical protein
MSKFLLNLLVQISKALVYSKIKFYSKKNSPVTFGPAAAHFLFFSTSHFPPFPLGLGLSAGPAHPHGPTGRLLPPASEPSAHDVAGRPRAAPWSTLTTSTRRKIMASSILLQSPIKRRHFPSSITGNRRLQSGAIEAPSTPAIEGARPPPPRLRTIKARPALGEDSYTSNAPSLSPQRAVALSSRGSAAGETPLHCLPSRGNPAIELACPPFLSLAPWSELSGTGELPSAAMAAGPRWTGPTRSTDSWTWSTGFPLGKQFLEIPISGILHLGPSSFLISTGNP